MNKLELMAAAFAAGVVTALVFYYLYVKAKAWTAQEEAKLAVRWSAVKSAAKK